MHPPFIYHMNLSSHFFMSAWTCFCVAIPNFISSPPKSILQNTGDMPNTPAKVPSAAPQYRKHTIAKPKSLFGAHTSQLQAELKSLKDIAIIAIASSVRTRLAKVFFILVTSYKLFHIFILSHLHKLCKFNIILTKNNYLI